MSSSSPPPTCLGAKLTLCTKQQYVGQRSVPIHNHLSPHIYISAYLYVYILAPQRPLPPPSIPALLQSCIADDGRPEFGNGSGQPLIEPNTCCHQTYDLRWSVHLLSRDQLPRVEEGAMFRYHVSYFSFFIFFLLSAIDPASP